MGDDDSFKSSSSCLVNMNYDAAIKLIRNALKVNLFIYYYNYSFFKFVFIERNKFQWCEKMANDMY